MRWYLAGLGAADVLAGAVAGGLVVLTRDGVVARDSTLTWAALSLLVVWPLLLSAAGTYDGRLIGTGSDEYRRVLRAGLLGLATVGFTSYAFGLELSRSLVVVAVPGLTAVGLLVRYGARRQLRRLRATGRCTKRVVVVGRGGAALTLVRQLDRERFAGLEVVAACVTPADRERFRRLVDLPVGSLDDVVDLAARLRADTIAVTSASETAAEYLRRLSWQLEGTGIELLVAPGLVEVAGPRLHIRPFEGLPLLSVEEPQFTGWRRVVKGLVDRSVAGSALVLLSPLLLAVALTVRMSSPGPVFYRQERIGLRGEPFTMVKFRSMVVDADQQLAGLDAANESDGLLFKMREDPRITRVGRWMRRFSVDEVPQLLNVLGGSMSLVGPRPPLPREVARYDDQVSRRLLVKPGLTGLWQISGRSDLAWEDAVRLDLRYVENWSLAMDLLILWKTARAVLSSSGAY
ncbi:exopolysaccharide biosynthesis polyprenyl glycosylphosphotransferase [Modestobacter sp. I12A-02628]|uniref:Sugar transferase n=1 Tax=Goekera deserti TaxID=2497753 RepID=A0A7K3WGT1_9ACTN|nr:sugar transferase [Goekera deserti]MPQ99426.1 exopolysaccharide biosynthesis polyprenyl glycosylphosphotransferase [Goekera deserti]NDI48913.1 exopolysaccharide biosynthesis polyprenyl glycosylphosphotransferase [Goekera deserti]NEL55617.1 sugar transferase [Goekera deserti]